MKNIIEGILFANIKDNNNFFVFPTQTAADLWADRTITAGPVSAVAMERFMAWDDFKSKSIKSKQQDKESVPSVMREIFATVCIGQNAEKPFLNSLVVPEYAKSADGFTSWIASLLPGLSLWKNRFTAAGIAPDAEDKDLLELYKRYSDFLKQFNLFDPAWETPPFEADGRHYFIFFPEILSDYLEYKEILTSSPADITVINIPQEILSKEPAEVSFFSNSRVEIKSVALYLRKLHDEKNISWDEIALSVPDMDTYGPYLERELELYQIPYVSRNAKPLSSNGAGNFFAQLMDCVNQNFSFESVKNLLLNDSLPWKSPEACQQLISFGQNNNCITSYVYGNKQVDVWEESFRESRGEELANTFYTKLKYHGTALVKANSFHELRELYFKFRGEFFDMEKCSEKADRILSRCISELAALIDIEEKFGLNKKDGNLNLKNCYSFYTQVLDGVNYLEQTKKTGVALLPYKLSATAPYSAQVVVDSSQQGLSVIYKELSFLREDKRKALFGNAEDPNVTELFIKLYQMNSTSGNFYFSAANKTFEGYAQASSYLTEVNYAKGDKKCDLFEKDFFAQEKAWFAEHSQDFPKQTAKTVVQGFNFWKESQKKEATEDSKSLQFIAEKIDGSKYFENGKLKISATSLRNFLNCPREWLMSRFCNLNEQNNEAELFDHQAIGLLYHKFFEIFFGTLKQKELPIHTTPDGMEAEYQKIYDESLERAMQEEKNSFLAKELLKATSEKFKEDLKVSVESFMNIFEGCKVLDTEREFKFEPEGQDFVCTGIIDCLLQEAQGGAKILVDFKSFSSAIPERFYASPDLPLFTPIQEQELPDFQIPMYLYLMKNQKSPIVVENSCFFQVSKGEIAYVMGEELFSRYKAQYPSKRTKQVSDSDFIPTMDLFQKGLEYFNQQIKAKDFSVNSFNQNFDTCNGCSNRAICRRTFNISRQD